MKTISEISDILRAKGYKFAQTRLMADLEEVTPIATHKRYKFYDDTVVDTLEEKYVALRVKKEPEPVATQADLEKIYNLLMDISNKLNEKETVAVLEDNINRLFKI